MGWGAGDKRDLMWEQDVVRSNLSGGYEVEKFFFFIGSKICIVIVIMYVTNLSKICFKIIVTYAGAKFYKIQSLDFKNFDF